MPVVPLDRVLFLGSSPDAADHLRLDVEYAEISGMLRRSRPGEFDVRSSWAVRLDALSRELLRWKPAIVHFSGHGSTRGLVFEADDGSGDVAPIEPLAALFGACSSFLRCVVLNACHTDAQAAALADRVDFVVGTTALITDQGAIAFAAGFYRDLSVDLNWCAALDGGRREVAEQGLPDVDLIRSYPACP